MQFSLKQKALRGFFWATVANFGTQLLTPLASLILAGLLTPADFGLVAIAQLTISIIRVFHTFGINQALIHWPGDTKRAANTAFPLVVIWSTFLYLLTIVIAPGVALFFNQSDATLIIQVMALTILITSFGVVPAALLEKELEFKRKVIPELFPVGAYIIIAMVLALKGFGVWSIVWGRVGQATLTTILLWKAAQWRLSLSFDLQIARAIIDYGKHLLAGSILTVIFLHIDNAYVGKIIGVESLGFYTFAFAIANLPATSITFVVNRVSLPSFVKFRDKQRGDLVNAYLYSVRLVTMIILPAVLGLAVLSSDILYVLYGDKWSKSIVLIQILSFYALFRSIGGLPTSMLLAIGKQALIPKLLLVYVFTLAFLLWPAAQWFGTVGVSIVMTSVMIVGSTGWLLLVNHYLNISWLRFWENLSPQITASVIMAIYLLIAIIFLREVSLINLIILTISGAGLYIATMLSITKGQVYREMNDVVKTMLGF